MDGKREAVSGSIRADELSVGRRGKYDDDYGDEDVVPSKGEIERLLHEANVASERLMKQAHVLTERLGPCLAGEDAIGSDPSGPDKAQKRPRTEIGMMLQDIIETISSAETVLRLTTRRVEL